MELLTNLISIKNDFELETKEINGNTFIPHALEKKFFNLLLTDRDKIKANPECLKVAQEISAKIRDVFLRIILNGSDGEIWKGQYTYNAAEMEIAMRNKFNFEYGGLGIIDHEYHHTGYGINAADLFAISDIELICFNKEIKDFETIKLSFGTKVDAKIFDSIQTEEYYIKNNIWHDADYLIAYLSGAKTAHLIDKKLNILKINNFLNEKDFQMLHLDFDPIDNLFTVSEFR